MICYLRGWICYAWIFGSFVLWSCGPASQYQPPTPTEEELEWEQFYVAERQGNLEEAKNGFYHMCRRDKPYVRSCYDYSRILYSVGTIDSARRESVRFVTAYPDVALSPAATKRLASSFRETGEFEKGITVLGALKEKVNGTDVWDSIQYEIAKLHKSASQTEKEKKALSVIVNKGRWGSQLWDDSIWRLIQIAKAQSDAPNEERLLKKMLSAKESSWIIASYNSSYYDDALFRLGELYYETGRLGDAYLTFRQLSNWKTSRLKDDGLLWAAKVSKDLKKHKRACKLLLSLIEKMPQSNSYRKAERFLREWQCVIQGD